MRGPRLLQKTSPPLFRLFLDPRFWPGSTRFDWCLRSGLGLGSGFGLGFPLYQNLTRKCDLAPKMYTLREQSAPLDILANGSQEELTT